MSNAQQPDLDDLFRRQIRSLVLRLADPALPSGLIQGAGIGAQPITMAAEA
jgi:hypothetical protein